MKPLPLSFYRQTDVLQLAEQLLGKVLHTRWDNEHCYARIVETEAYNGVVDKASHAYGNRRTNRTETMYAAGGIAYVYLCYGMHHLFNVVTGKKDVPQAVLIRAAEPLFGVEYMLERRNKKQLDTTLTKGPGSLAQAMGIHTLHSGESLTGQQIWIADDGFNYNESDIIATPRIGVDYAGDDALLPYRFIVKGNKFVSGKAAQNL